MTATDTTTVPDVDLTREVPCTVCENAATWIATPVCCTVRLPVCDPCRLQALRDAADFAGYWLECIYCGQSAKQHRWHWRPL